MRKQLERVHSPQLGRGVSLWSYGHWGPPLIAFPTAAGFAHEWEAQGMLEALAPLLDGGRLKLYCPESNVAEAWTRGENDPAWRIRRHIAYERFVLDTLVPKIRDDCRTPDIPLTVAGASLGAFYAANLALKHPETFRWALCLSGRYSMTHFTGGFADADVYFNDPLAYVPNLGGEALERIRRWTHLVLVCGQGMWEEGCIEETRALAGACAANGISHELDLWGTDVSHDWGWWKRQAQLHLGRRFGGG
jgi:esterase/lipase superfamily enzyme